MTETQIISTEDLLKSADKATKLSLLEIMLRDQMLFKAFKVKAMIREVYRDINEKPLLEQSGAKYVNKVRLMAVTYINDDLAIRVPMFTKKDTSKFIKNTLDSGFDILNFTEVQQEVKNKIYKEIGSMVQEMADSGKIK